MKGIGEIMTTVYLHIGTMKTGTSALQKFFYDNRALLAEKGYCFPQFKFKLSENSQLRNANFLVYHSEKEGEEREAEEKALREKAFSTLGNLAAKYENIILTDEVIWHRAPYRKDFWSRLIEDLAKINCRLKVVVYLRRQDLVIQSLWNQYVKTGKLMAQSFQESIETGAFRFFSLDYYRRLNKIAVQVGKENMIVRVYERGQFEGDGHTIQSDFMKSIGLLNMDGFKLETESVNVSLNANYIEIKRIMNRVPEYREMSDFMARPIVRASAGQAQWEKPEKVSMFSHEEQVRFFEKYAESNRKTAQDFLGREDGRLFYETVQEEPAWQIDTENMYRDLIISMTEMFCRQEKKIQELQEEITFIKKDMLAVWKSAIFRGYRKMQKIMKGDKA